MSNELLLDTTETLPGGVRINTQTRSVNVSMIPFIRSRLVYFRMEGLLPNMRHKPYFDGVVVSAWCREQTYVQNSTVDNSYDADLASSYVEHPNTPSDLISDSDGVIEGTFFIPNTPALRFRAGRREFKVLDWNATSDDNAISKAFATYHAQGVLENRQTTITTIFPPPPAPPTRWIDPVAQSFLVEKEEGYFVTAVDVFFSSKASNTVPVRLQIRPMQNGIPTNDIVPLAECIKLPSAVNITSAPDQNNPATYTTFTFTTPIYLNGLTEYCVVIIAESDEYEVWTAVTTEFVVGSTANRIMKQPAMGSFFKSQNGSTWTPDQSRDLTFRIKTARFNPANTGTAYFENVAVTPTLLGSNPFRIKTAVLNPTVVVTFPNHGLYVDSKVKFTGATSFGGLTNTNFNASGGYVVTAVLDNDHFEFVMVGTASSAISGGGTAVMAHGNFDYTDVFPVANQLALSGTDVAWSAKLTNGKSIAGSETPYVKDASYIPISMNGNSSMRVPKVIASTDNETNAMGGVKSASMRALLTTNSKYLSPVIDLNRLSMVIVNNRVDRQAASPATGFNVPDTFVAETSATGGSSAAKHIFKAVTLEEAAVGLKVLFAANRPSDSYIELYYRTVPSGGENTLSTTDWVLATIDEEVRTDDNPGIFREYEYTIDSLAPFTVFQFKMVFKSMDSCHVPQVRDFRAIALAT